jgi:hypothetical protein
MPLLRRATFFVCTFLALATAAIWFRSNRISDILVFDRPGGHHYELVTLAGQFRVTVVDRWPDRQGLRHFRGKPPVGYPIYGQTVVPVSYWRFGCGSIAGSDTVIPEAFVANAQVWAQGVRFRLWSFPMAVPIALLGAYPAWAVFMKRRRRLQRERRVAGGLCVHCGYDLRHSRGQCPECGGAIGAVALPVH